MTISPSLILSAALALSMAGNVWLTSAYLSKRDDVARADEQRKEATTSALACSKATDRYREAAENRAVDAEKRAAEAQGKANVLAQRGRAELTRPQAVPGDACKSAQVETDEWLQRRRSSP
jgi:uncharacterized membrane protein YccC